MGSNMDSTTECIVRELTHVIVPFYNSLSLSEGLACLMQEKFGKNATVFNYGEPIHSFSKQYLSSHEHVAAVIGEANIPLIDIMGKDRTAFYVLSHSFVKYLVEEYGIKDFMKVNDAPKVSVAYEEVYGKELDVLRDEWLAFLDKQEASDATFEERIQEKVVARFDEMEG